MSKHQELMDKAYDKYQKNDWSYNQFLANISEAERRAVVLGNLNYQVENGGFYQWVENGYCVAFPFVRMVLAEMDTENSKKVITLLNAIEPDLKMEVVTGDAENKGIVGDYFIESEEYEMVCCTECGGDGFSEEYMDCDCEGEDDDCEICCGTGEYVDTIQCDNCFGEGEIEELTIVDYDYSDYDNIYYSINDELMKEAEEFLKGLDNA